MKMIPLKSAIFFVLAGILFATVIATQMGKYCILDDKCVAEVRSQQK